MFWLAPVETVMLVSLVVAFRHPGIVVLAVLFIVYQQVEMSCASVAEKFSVSVVDD